MPLFIPIILGAAALSGIGWGTKKAIDGVQGIKKATRIANAAQVGSSSRVALRAGSSPEDRHGAPFSHRRSALDRRGERPVDDVHVRADMGDRVEIDDSRVGAQGPPSAVPEGRPLP